MGASAGHSGGWLAVCGRGRGRRVARVQRGHEGGSGAERLVLARGDEREAALDIEGREGRRSSRSSRDQGGGEARGRPLWRRTETRRRRDVGEAGAVRRGGGRGRRSGNDGGAPANGARRRRIVAASRSVERVGEEAVRFRAASRRRGWSTGSVRRGEVRSPDPDLDRGRGEGRAVVGRGSGASRGGVGCVGARVRGLRGGSGPAGWAGGGQLGHLAQQGGVFLPLFFFVSFLFWFCVFFSFYLFSFCFYFTFF